MAGPQNFGASFAKGLATSSNIEKGLTISAANQQARTDLKTNAAKKTYDSNLQVLLGGITHTNEEGKEVTGGMFVQESDGTIVLAPDAMKKLEALSDGNREQYSNALLMNDMMGTYHAETPDGQLEKKRNQQVFAPVLAKKGAVPYSVEQAAAAGNVDSIALKKQYENGTLRGYVTPAINQEGLLSLLNVFGSDKADDQPQVATREEILTGLQARADKFNADADALMPKRSRAINLAESQSDIELSNIGGGSDQGMIELVNGVFDENVGRGSTNSLLKNLQTIYAANPKYTVASQPASQTDPSIEVGSKEDVMVNTQGIAKTFEEAYPSLQGLDGERLATELQNLKDSGELDNFGDQQKEQIFADLKEQGIGSIPDLMTKRKEQKVNAQDQYKEILLINTVAARTDANGKLVLPDGRTPKEAADTMFNEFYTGAPGATLSDLATAQNSRRTSIRADQVADTNELIAKTANTKARTSAFNAADDSALDWAEFEFEKYKYLDKAKKQADKDTRAAFKAIEDKYASNVKALVNGTYSNSGVSFVDHTNNLRDLLTGGQASPITFFGKGKGPTLSEKSTLFRQFSNDVTSVSVDYYNAASKNAIGRDNQERAKEAFLSIAKDDKQRENLEKMWQNEGQDIYAYNFAQPERYREHKFMQEEVILQKVFSSLENDESIWNALFGGIPLIRNIAGKGPLRGGQRLDDYWGDVWADDLSANSLVNSLRDSVGIRYEDNKPVEIVAKRAVNGEELEEGIDFDDFINNGSITGTELNWLLSNLDKLGDYSTAEEPPEEPTNEE